MSSNNVAHVSSVDKGLKMKIKRTKVPSTKIDSSKHEVIKTDGVTTATGSSGPTTAAGGTALLNKTPSVTLLSSAGLTTSSLSTVISSSTAASSSLSSSTSSSSSLSSMSAPACTSVLNAGTTSHLLTTLSSATPSSSLTTSAPGISTHSTLTIGPTVALLKATALAGSDGFPQTGSGKSPLKSSAIGCATVGDAKDGKSPKSKAAYMKKGKDGKVKVDGSSNTSSTSSGNTPLGGPGISQSVSGAFGGQAGGQTFSTISSTPFSSGATSSQGILGMSMTSEPRPGDTVHVKRDNPVHDPYEFNAKVEDKIELPPKKLKLEKVDNPESATSPSQPQHQQQQQQQIQSMQHSQLSSTSSSYSHQQNLHHSQQQHQHHQQQQQQQSYHAMHQMSYHPLPQHPHQPQQQQQHHQHPQQQQQQQQLPSTSRRSIGVDACSVGVVTEPECLGPCEPGTIVGLEGIVWKETDNGILVVNVTWRGKTYVGTLMDATRYAWAPPRPSGCESPVSDFESRTPKGRGKRTSRNSVQTAIEQRLPEGRRLRKGRRGTVNSSSSNFTAPPSPAKSDISVVKRKTRPSESESEKSKRSRSCSRGSGAESPTVTDGYIICPEPNCHKKYKHMNGLRYHRTHAHRKSSYVDESRDDEEEKDEEEEKAEKKKISEREERMKAKERQRLKDQQKGSDRDSKDSIDDDIPLKEIARASKSGNNADDSTNNIASSPTVQLSSNVGSKIDPQVVLRKTTVPLSKDLVAACQNAAQAKKKDSNSNSEVLSSTSSSVSSSSSLSASTSSFTSSTSVPSASSMSTVDEGGSLTSHATFNQAPGTASQPVMTTLKSPITSQVYQISPTGILGGVPFVTQSGQPMGLVSAPTLPLTGGPGAPPPLSLTNATTTTSVLGVALTADKQGTSSANKFGSGTKSAVSTARPIVPAPSPHTCISGHTSSLSSLSSSHAPLKPIQPKPTIMGEYPTVSPSLADLNRDKARKTKKKKDRESPGATSLSSSTGRPQCLNDHLSIQDGQKDERSVIRGALTSSSTPSKPFGTASPLMDGIRPANSPFQHIGADVTKGQFNSDNQMTPGQRLAIPPSTLSINSDAKSPINDDVHSPAYSDISDANDSGSPMQQDSPSKKESGLKKDNQMNGAPHIGPDGNPLSQHYSNMYYFGGPPNYLPHGISPQMSSPSLSKTGLKKDEDGRPPSSADDTGDKKDGRPPSSGDMDMQQKSLINYYAHVHGVNPVQLQYNLAYSPSSLDPYAAQMLAQQHLEQQKRLLQHQQEFSSKGEDGKITPSSIAGTPNRLMAPGSSGPGQLGKNPGEQKRFGDDRDQTLRDKQNENHQILKENIELKSQMNQDQQAFHNMLKQQQSDIIRAQMYQQQKQKLVEAQQADKRSKGPPELAPVSSRNYDMKQGELGQQDIKKEFPLSKNDGGRPGNSLEMKRSEIKEEPGTTRPSSRPSSAGRPLSGSGAPTSSSSLPTSSLPTSLPAGMIGTLTPASISAAGFPYASYYPGTMYRALSPHSIIGYSAAPAPPGAYPYPYRMGPPNVDNDGKLVDSSSKSVSVVPDGVDPSKLGTSSSPGLGSTGANQNVHKIHELQEKGRPSPGGGPSSPSKPGRPESVGSVNSGGPSTPGSGTGGEKGNKDSSSANPGSNGSKQHREYTSSPPTQRHVHTHHHTHVVGGFSPLISADAYSAMFSHPAAAAAAAATLQPGPHPFPAPPPSAPKP